MSPTHTRRGGKLYRYYVSNEVLKKGLRPRSHDRLPAGEIETAVVDQIRRLLQSPEVIVGTWRALKQKRVNLKERDVRAHLLRFDEFWHELFPEEQARIVRLLVERVQINENGAEVTLRTAGLESVLDDLGATPLVRSEAA